MPQKILWDEDEALILLDALLQVQSGTCSRKEAVATVSTELRTRAIYRGLAVDDIFRNQNGIHMQLSLMEYVYTDGKQGLKRHKAPGLFQDVVSLYKNDQPSYEKRLAEAKTIIESANTVQARFFEWLAREVPSEQAFELYSVLHTVCADIEKFCAQERILNGSFFKTTDLDAVERVVNAAKSNKTLHSNDEHRSSKAYSVIVLYYEFLKENKDTATEDGKPPPMPAKLHSKFYPELLSTAKIILSTNFVNGMRKNATIAKKKFRKAYLDLTGEELSESVDIDELTSAAGFEYADKFYAVSEENQQRLRELVLSAVSMGNRVMFYEEIYQCHLDFMADAGIFSKDLLKVILKQILPDMRYKRTFFSPRDDDSLEKDIINCYGNALMRTFGEIKAHLLYADLLQIRLVCSRSNKLVWAKEETYALTDRIQLSQFDIDRSLDIVSQDIGKQGFSVFSRISVFESAEWNPYVPETAIREALFIKHLAPLYERSRSIITLPGVSFSAPMVMAEYCKGLHEATLSELQTYEEELTDKSFYSLSAAYDTMIRVDREHFVSLNAIEFDVHAIDVALSLFAQDDIVPLGSVKSFTSFPEVTGYPWNLFLLDSFCHHKSMRYRTMGGPAKSKPVGAIFPIYMQFSSYEDLLAHVAAKSDLTLHIEDVAKFFTQNAYTLRRIDTKGIVTKAQEIRFQEGIADV